MTCYLPKASARRLRNCLMVFEPNVLEKLFCTTNHESDR